MNEMGRREGVLLSMPVTQASTDLYQTHYESLMQFASKDTLQGVKTMSLEMVDEFGQPLFFRVPYELKIGVYYK